MYNLDAQILLTAKFKISALTLLPAKHCTVDSYWDSPIHLPFTPAWPVTSETCPLPLDYSRKNGTHPLGAAVHVAAWAGDLERVDIATSAAHIALRPA